MINIMYGLGFKRIDSIDEIPIYRENIRTYVDNESLDRHRIDVFTEKEYIRSKEFDDKTCSSYISMFERLLIFCKSNQNFIGWLTSWLYRKILDLIKKNFTIECRLSDNNIMCVADNFSKVITTLTYDIIFYYGGTCVHQIKDCGHIVQTNANVVNNVIIDGFDYHNCDLDNQQVEQIEHIRLVLEDLPTYAFKLLYVDNGFFANNKHLVLLIALNEMSEYTESGRFMYIHIPPKD